MSATLAGIVDAATVWAETTDPDEQRSLITSALPIAGLFVLVLLVAVFFLWRSMTKQMRKIDPNLPEGRDDREQALDRRLTERAVERGAEADDDTR
jgi:hypothetical protein